MKIGNGNNIQTTMNFEVREARTMSKSEISGSIKNEENHFQGLLEKVDESKTKTEQKGLDGRPCSETIYYDKDGNELYKKLHFANSNTDMYHFASSDGGNVTYTDLDSDGNIDEMSYYNGNDGSAYSAKDNNDDGTFDSAYNPNTRKTFDLESLEDVDETSTPKEKAQNKEVQQEEKFEDPLLKGIYNFFFGD